MSEAERRKYAEELRTASKSPHALGKLLRQGAERKKKVGTEADEDEGDEVDLSSGASPTGVPKVKKAGKGKTPASVERSLDDFMKELGG